MMALKFYKHDKDLLHIKQCQLVIWNMMKEYQILSLVEVYCEKEKGEKKEEKVLKGYKGRFFEE